MVKRVDEEIVAYSLKENKDGSITIEALVNIYYNNKCYSKDIKVRLKGEKWRK